ncbi:MAG: hypothetical protein KDB82_17460 [Planctomycetes bacterium]|nr:hypothetical protein [Planctomycetota bacterium]
MVQRVLSCPSCGAQIDVPDNYFRATINCFHCGTPVKRISGTLFETEQAPAQPGRQYSAPPPSQQYPAPPQHYNMQGYPGYPPSQYTEMLPPRKSRTGLIVALVVLVVLVGAVIGIGVWASSLGGVDASGPWHHHVSEEGGFEADFPGEPKLSTKSISTPLGSRPMKRAQFMPLNSNFEVSYFDIDSPGEQVEYDYGRGADAIAKEVGGRVTGNQPHKVDRYTGRVFNISIDNGRKTTALLLRRGDRVFVVICENHRISDQSAADRFINSFKLLKAEGAADPYRCYSTVGNHWAHESISRVPGGEDFKSVMRYEVLSVDANEANVRITTFMNGDVSGLKSEFKVNFNETPNPQTQGFEKVREKLTTSLGTFDCDRTTVPTNDFVTDTWIDRATGLIVRVRSTRDGEVTSTMELTEYSVK